MNDFRPAFRPAPEPQPNAKCCECGWLRKVPTHCEPSEPCAYCGGWRTNFLPQGRTFFRCVYCSTLRLDFYTRCKGCGAGAPEREVLPGVAVGAHRERPRGRKVKTMLAVIMGAIVDKAEEKAKKKPPAG